MPQAASWVGTPSIKGRTESTRMALLTLSLVGLQYVMSSFSFAASSQVALASGKCTDGIFWTRTGLPGVLRWPVREPLLHLPIRLGDLSPLTVHGHYRLYSLSSPARPHKISHVPRLDRWSVVGSDNATHCGSHHRPLAIEVGETSTVHDRRFHSCRYLLTGLGVDFRNSWNVRPGCRDGRWGNSISLSVFYKGTVQRWSLASDRDMAITKVADLTDWIALEKARYHCRCSCKYLRGRLRD